MHGIRDIRITEFLAWKTSREHSFSSGGNWYSNLIDNLRFLSEENNIKYTKCFINYIELYWMHLKKKSVVVFYVVCLSYSIDAAITQNVLNLFFKIVICSS